MPRPSARPLALAGLALLALAVAALGPATAATALAAAAGSVFEAAPFVFVAERFAATGRGRAFAGLAGCGCGGRLPGALAFAAIALCWIAFGPLVALARTGAALALVAVTRSARDDDVPDDGDPFATLATVGASAAATALALAAAGGRLGPLSATATGRAIGALAGAALGIVAPCATAAVAIAAALAPHAPFAAAGVLATGGLIRVPHGPSKPRAPTFGACAAHETTVASTVARLAIAGALAWLAWHGPAGFLNPRARPALAVGALVGLANARRPTGRTRGPAVSGLALAALVAGSPVPLAATTATSLADAYPGERLAFFGRARAVGRATVLERFTITCCRADAFAETVRVARRLPTPDGSWVVARGTLRALPGGALVLEDVTWRATRAPADPFAYR